MELLEQAVSTARGDLGRARLDPEIEVPLPALIPELWIEDVQERLAEYQRLSACRTVAEVRDVLGAWEDAFGEPPPEVLNLGWQAEARIRARELGIERVAWLKIRVALDFHETTPVPPAHVAALVSREPGRFKLAAGDPRRLLVDFGKEEGEYPFRFLHWVFRRLERGIEEGPGAGIGGTLASHRPAAPATKAPPPPKDKGPGPPVVLRRRRR